MENLESSPLATYQSLPHEAKQVLDILAHACARVRRDAIERLFPSIETPRSQLRGIMQQLNTRIIYYYKIEDIDYYTTEKAPEFYITLLLQQVKEGRDIEKEIGSPSFWEEINREGKPARDRIFARLFDIELPGYNGLFQPVIHLLEATSKIKPSVDISKTFPKRFLIHHFRDIIRHHVEQICPDPFIDCWFKQFSNTYPNSPSFLAILKDLRSIPELLFTGRLDEIPNRIDPATQEGASLLGMYHLYRREFDQALQYFTEGETDKNGYDDHRIDELTPFSLGRAISLLALPTASPEKFSDLTDNMFLQLMQTIKSDKKEKGSSSPNLDDNLLSPLAQYFLHALKKHLGLHTASSLHFLERQASNMGWNLPLLIDHFIPLIKMDHSHPEEKHEKKMNTTPGLPQEWEKDLSSLLTIVPEPEQELHEIQISPTAKARIVYLIQERRHKYWNIVPMLQTSKDGITWTSGRKIAANKLKDGSALGMSDLDRKIATSCISDEERLILLSGHPHVYLEEKNKFLPISIVSKKPEICIYQDITGYRIYTNLYTFLSKTEFKWERFFRHATTMRITAQQSHILRVLDQIHHLPFEARDILIALQKHLQGIITIHSDIVDDDDVKKTVQGDNRIVVQITPALDVFRAKLFTKPFGTIPPYCNVGTDTPSVSALVKEEKWLATRDFEKELQNSKIVRPAIREFANHYETENSYLFTHPDNCRLLVEFIREHPDIATIEWAKGTPWGARFSLWAIS